MARRRSRDARPRRDTARPFPVYPEQGWPLGKDLELDEALAQLEAALTDCDGALASAIRAMTSDDIMTALRSVPFERRSAVLGPLGLKMNPRQVTRGLCQDLRSRMGRADEHAAWHAASALTVDASVDVMLAAFADEFGDAARLPDPLARWGAALCRLAVWAHGLASVLDARLWLWASWHPWFRPEGLSANQIEAIAEAAERVAAASPTFSYRMLINGEPGDGDIHGESAAIEESADGDDDGEAGEPTPDLADAPRDEKGHDSVGEVYTVGVTGDSGSGSAAGIERPDSRPADAAGPQRPVPSIPGTPPVLVDLRTPEQLRVAGNALEALLGDAAHVALCIVEELKAMRPPTREYLVTLSRTRDEFDGLVEALTAAGALVTDETMAAVREAVEEVGSRAADAGARALLGVVCGLVAPHDQTLLLAQLAQVQTEARDLLALRPWDAQARESAGVLGLLVQLAEPGQDAAAQMALMQRWAQQRPDLSFLAVQAQQLSVPHSPVSATFDCTELAPVESSEPVDTTSDIPAGISVEPAEPAVEPADDMRVEQFAEPESEPPIQPTRPELVVEEVPSRRVVETVALLISAQQFGLTAALERAAGWSATQQACLRIAALADVVRYQNGAVAAALRNELAELDANAVAGDSPSLLLTVPALLRIALVTGEPTAGAMLQEFAGRVEPNLSDVAEQVGRRALRGVLLGSKALSVLADVTEVERGIRGITSAAQHVRTRPRTMRFKRATDISKIWLRPNGILGRPLSIVEQDNTQAVDEVADDIGRLTDSSFVKSEIDTLDRRFQGTSGKPIEGAGRQDLLNLVQESLKPLADWVEAVRSLSGRDARTDGWSAEEIADMRSAILDRKQGVVTALKNYTSHNNPLIEAAAHAAVASLTKTFGILESTNRVLPVVEPAPAFALTADLLRVPGAVVDVAFGAVTLPEHTTLQDLLAAVERDWDEALTGQVDVENFEAAHFLLEVVDEGRLPVVEGPRVTLTVSAATVEQAERGVRAELDAEHDKLMTELRQARLNNEISDEQDGELTRLLEDARRKNLGRNLPAVRRALGRVAAVLPEYKAEAQARLTVRLKQLQHEGRIDADTSRRVMRLMDDGQLSTAEEHIYFLEIDEDVPDVHQAEDLQRFFQRFFPQVPRAMPTGITRELVMLVNSRGQLPSCPVLDFGGLSPDLATLAADALNNWRQLGQAERRSSVSETEQLLPALRLVGLEARRQKRLDDLPRSRDRRFIEVTITDTDIIGDALVPAFGSKLSGRLRVLLAWGQPSADLLMSWADGDPSGESLLIAHFGTMSAQTRRDLATGAVRRSAPIVVLDDAALAYLAAHGSRRITATMNVLLPFSGVNPYLRQKRGVVAPEMFYGRDKERRSVLDPEGTQLVFGGRGLGKSALLHSAAEQFEKQAQAGERVAVYVDLKAVGIRAKSAIDQEAIWDGLFDRLTRHGVLTASRRGERRPPSSYEQVEKGVQAWLDADSRRRLLVLLDEADQFFEADMPNFRETTRLKSLGQQSNGRVKVVFAGLHSVQRYAKTARNAPFGHMAQRPTVIGPLRPQHAANLLTQPLAALGFGFEDPDLVNRVLGYCSYQPFLLQILANRLIEVMHDKRKATGVGQDDLPYVIKRADVQSVETQAELRADIRAAFHETLNLDHRYGVIAHVLAHHAHEHGLDARLTGKELREECLTYWPIGFARLDVEGFRAYLQEMTGLGVLAPNNDGRGWHLRSVNALNMIGTREDVETQLVSAAELSVTEEFLVSEARHTLQDGRRSPLTAAQLDDVLGDHSNQVRVVIGSEATGIDLVADAVREAAKVGNRFVVPVVASRRQFEEQLVAGKPGERRVVLDDLMSVAPNESACLEALEAAQIRLPTARGVTRSAVVVVGPAQMNLWRKVFADDDEDSGRLPVATVALRRYDAASLRVWSLETNVFTGEERRTQLLRATGGWPLLVERAAQMVKGEPGIDEPEALRRLEAELATPDGAAALVTKVGITGDEQLCEGFEGILSMIDSGGMTRSDLDVAAELFVDEPSTAVECLIALQVFDIAADGKFVPEQLLVRCWPHRA